MRGLPNFRVCLDAEGTFQCSVVLKTTVNATFQNYSVYSPLTIANIKIVTVLMARQNVRHAFVSKVMSLKS